MNKSERRRYRCCLEACGLFSCKGELGTCLPRRRRRPVPSSSPANGGILYKSLTLWLLLLCCGSAPLMRFKSKASNIPLYIFCLGKSRPFLSRGCCLCSMSVIGFSPNATWLLGWGFWTIQHNSSFTKTFFLGETAFASRKLKVMIRKTYGVSFSVMCMMPIFLPDIWGKIRWIAMNRLKPGSHVCNLDVIASPAILLPRGILRKAGKEEEKPWEINLMAQMGSALAWVFCGSKRACQGFLLHKATIITACAHVFSLFCR